MVTETQKNNMHKGYEQQQVCILCCNVLNICFVHFNKCSIHNADQNGNCCIESKANGPQ